MAAKRSKTSASHALSGKRILISNDDGVHAPGIKVLEAFARSVSDDVWVVAPESEQSGAGHSLTLRRPLRVRKVGGRKNCFAVDGTPTDCSMMAINHIMRDAPPDIVLSGVNRGCNMGDDVHYSGTVAAAMEATILGVPSIAFSQHMTDGSPCKWATAEHWIATVAERLGRADWPRNVLINVNFPDVVHGAVKGIKVARQGGTKSGDNIIEAFDPKGRPYYWIGEALAAARRTGSDWAITDDGYIAVTPLCLDLTHAATMKRLRSIVE